MKVIAQGIVVEVATAVPVGGIDVGLEVEREVELGCPTVDVEVGTLVDVLAAVLVACVVGVEVVTEVGVPVLAGRQLLSSTETLLEPVLAVAMSGLLSPL